MIIDLDKINNTGDEKCADFLFASDQCGGWIVAIEMKKGSPDVSKCVKQLQGAAKIAESWISHGDIKNFYAIIASGNMPAYGLRELRKQSRKVRFHNEKYPITHIRCGTELSNAFHGKYT